jgi:peptide/nickel transport system substrate-binding protein
VTRSFAFLLLAILLTGCATPRADGGTDQGSSQSDTQPGRTLVLVMRAEPGSLAGTVLISTGIGTGGQRRIFNAALTQGDGELKPRPYLAEALPQLNSDSWQVFPDGRMETVYRLRPNLTWHDGAPLTASDFVFAWRIYTTPEFGIASNAPHKHMEDVVAPDDRTVIFRWKAPYPDAGAVAGVGAGSGSPSFTPLPRHILEPIYENDRDAIPTHAFWTREFVGAGPYRLDRWEAGAFIEAVAFDGHVLGRPKIDRVKFTWNQDPNAVLAALLSGEAHVPVDRPLRVQQGVILERDWNSRGAGTISYRPELPRLTQFQHRPEYANPQAVRDVRVRRALAHGIDRNAINDSLYEGKGIIVDTLIAPGVDYYADLERAVAKYPLDPRRTEQLMAEGGYFKGADGMYVSPTEGRLSFEIRVIASAQSDAERAIMADGWQRLGFDFEQASYTPVQTQDGQTIGTFRALSSTGGAGGEDASLNYTSAAISRPENRWVGGNRGGWSNPEYDGLIDAFYTTLDRGERNRQLIQAWKLITEDLGILPLYFNPAVLATPTGLTGVDITAPDAELTWNIQDWIFR